MEKSAMRIHRCLKCMTPLPEGIQTCPVCGRVYGNWAWESIALRPGTILDGKYLVGEMLGRGGFGITYLGFDLLLEQKVAIKEYFPLSAGLVTRENGSTVVWHTTMLEKTCTEQGFSSFLKEARKMAKLGGIPGVVGVKSVFIENETAYIVMDYVEGETLQRKLEREGPMDFDTCVRLLTPVIQALGQVHSHGIVHRDISPDNLMVCPDGQLVLLDLGAAKEVDIRKSDGSVQSSRLVAKAGFSPLEQYTSTGRIGTWTDVYAMSATIYYCCTGKLPPLATERASMDTLAWPSGMDKEVFSVLSQGLAVRGKERIQTMDALLNSLTALTCREVIPAPPEPPTPPGEPEEPWKQRMAAAVAWLRQNPLTVAAGVFAIQLLVSLCTMASVGNVPVSLLRIGGYALMAGALLGVADRELVCWGGGCLALAQFLMGSISGVVGGLALAGWVLLLQCHRLPLKGAGGWLKRFWMVPPGMLCVYLIMFLAEFSQIPGFLLETLCAAALTLTLWVFFRQEP